MPGGTHPPLSVIMTWSPNYINPETRGWGLIVLCIVLMVLVYIVVALRVYARFIMSRNAGIDDVLTIINLVPLTGLAILIPLSQKKYGLDHHLWDNPLPVIIQSRKAVVALEMLYLFTTSTTKISILLFYRRLASGTISKGFLWTVYGAIAFVAIYWVVFTLNLYLGCRPFRAFWMEADMEWSALNAGKFYCFNEGDNLIGAAVMSMIQDFIACGMPSVLFWKTRLPPRQKIALGVLFGVGFLLCICGVLRIYYSVRVYFWTYDMTWESYWAWVWLIVETHIGVICASAPALKLLFKKVLQVSTVNGSFFRRTIKTDHEATAGNNTDIALTNRTAKTEKSYVGKTGWWETTVDVEQTVDFDDTEFRETKTSLPPTSDCGNVSDQDERPLHPASPTLWEDRESSRKFSPRESDFHFPRKVAAEEGQKTFYIDE